MLAGIGRDERMRQAAFSQVRMLSQQFAHLTRREIGPGFTFEGERIPLWNPQRGIFKPRRMRYLLSIRTVIPRKGGKYWYDDQKLVHQQIYSRRQSVDYAFMGNDPGAPDNRWLREAYDKRVPVIYFLGVAPGRYIPIFPVFIGGWDASALKAQVVFSEPSRAEPHQAPPPFPDTEFEKRYALREVKQRLHQASFRQIVLRAYDGRCAVSGLPEPRLLDAAHIIPDGEVLGQPVVSNGLPLSKIHHAAFDAHLIGIDRNYKLHLSERLLEKEDGPMLEALKRPDATKIRLPGRTRDFPDPDRLAQRFDRFLSAQ